jgi:hypothetical protein
MENAKFSVRFDAPVYLTTDLQKDLHLNVQHGWRIVNLDLRRLPSDQPNHSQNIYELTVLIHPEDVHPGTSPDELYAFRDRLLSVVSAAALVPVYLRSEGVITFDLGGGKHKSVSLGATTKKPAPRRLPSIDPIVRAQSLSVSHAAALRFIWLAINAEDPWDRFVYLAVCVELLAAVDSPEPRSDNPHCTAEACAYVLERCPQCGRDWKIPNPLKNRIQFIVSDEQLSKRFIHARNRVFHGGGQEANAEFRQELLALNAPLFLVVRNYVGELIGLTPVTEKELPLTFQIARLMMGICWTEPKDADPGKKQT